MKIAVIGAGVLGRLVALQTALKASSSVSIDLFEMNGIKSTSNASSVAGGMLAPLAEAVQCGAQILEFGLDSVDRWRALGKIMAENLPVEGSQKKDAGTAYGLKSQDYETALGLKQPGTVVLCHPEDQHLLVQFKGKLADLSHFSPKISGVVSEIGRDQLKTFADGIGGSFHNALWLQSEGVLEPLKFMNQALLILQNLPQVKIIEREQSLDQGLYDFVVDCRGVAAKKEISEIRGVRGEALLLHGPGIEVFAPLRLLHPRHAIYLIPRPDHFFYLGATSIESDNAEPITVYSALELLTAVYSMIPGLKDARIHQSFVGIRPTSVNDHPVLNVNQGLIKANGLGRHGFLLAPYIADKVCQLMGQKPLAGA